VVYRKIRKKYKQAAKKPDGLFEHPTGKVVGVDTVPEKGKALFEVFRVLKPEGRPVDSSHPRSSPSRRPGEKCVLPVSCAEQPELLVYEDKIL
jgi:hypothetical protein